MINLYNVISTDGFIAKKDSSEDFIPDDVFDDFIELCEENDAIIMGRKTYDAMQRYDKGLLDRFERLSIRKIVVTKDRDFRPKHGYIVAHSPEDALKSGKDVLVSSGPILNSYLIINGLVDKVTMNKLSGVDIGDGLRPFDIDISRFLGKPESTEKKSGRTLSTYRVIKSILDSDR